MATSDGTTKDTAFGEPVNDPARLIRLENPGVCVDPLKVTVPGVWVTTPFNAAGPVVVSVPPTLALFVTVNPSAVSPLEEKLPTFVAAPARNVRLLLPVLMTLNPEEVVPVEKKVHERRRGTCRVTQRYLTIAIAADFEQAALCG